MALADDPHQVLAWLAHRIATWAGSWWWRRVPHRRRRVWGLLFINAVSFSALLGLFLWMHQREILR